MDHARLERALAKYGGISHISLPRFKINKEFKGFGFIEFNTVEEAMKALKVHYESFVLFQSRAFFTKFKLSISLDLLT